MEWLNASGLWPLCLPAQEALAGSSEQIERSFHREEARGCWDEVDIGWGRWLYLWCLRLLKSLGVTSQVSYSLLPRLYFLSSSFFFPEITAPTLWIKHLVIKDSKLNNTNIRNSGKLSALDYVHTWSTHGCHMVTPWLSLCGVGQVISPFWPSVSSTAVKWGDEMS